MQEQKHLKPQKISVYFWKTWLWEELISTHFSKQFVCMFVTTRGWRFHFITGENLYAKELSKYFIRNRQSKFVLSASSFLPKEKKRIKRRVKNAVIYCSDNINLLYFCIAWTFYWVQSYMFYEFNDNIQYH